MQPITRQADYYGLPDNSPPPAPPAEHVADVLAKPTPWSGPTRVEAGKHDVPFGALQYHLTYPGQGGTTGELGHSDYVHHTDPDDMDSEIVADPFTYMKKKPSVPVPEKGRHRAPEAGQ
jgi:hypothetical protein